MTDERFMKDFRGLGVKEMIKPIIKVHIIAVHGRQILGQHSFNGIMC